MDNPIFTDNISASLQAICREMDVQDAPFVVYPERMGHILLTSLGNLKYQAISIGEGEKNKSPQTLFKVLEALHQGGATRHSMLVNLGGGLTSDLGGLAASLYMRGIQYVNIPTTLLAQVDASTGGKTAVNFCGIKNLIGTFHQPAHTLISTSFLTTLPPEQILSGWGEMLKHALLDGESALDKILSASPLRLSLSEWEYLVKESVAVKKAIVTSDPLEKADRRMLNLGHTLGHALEEYISPTPPHGYAIVVGLVCALVLSNMECKFPTHALERIGAYIRRQYPPLAFDCNDYEPLYELMTKDKKNKTSHNVNFSLLERPGVFAPPAQINKESIFTALDITRDILYI